jgi:hypothetical protein
VDARRCDAVRVIGAAVWALRPPFDAVSKAAALEAVRTGAMPHVSQ